MPARDGGKKAKQYEALRQQLGTDHPYEVWDRDRLVAEEPEIGDEVVGAIYGPEDGHVNPLNLLRAYTKAIKKSWGGTHCHRCHCEGCVQKNHAQRFEVVLQDGTRYNSAKVILSAGLGSAQLGPKLGFVAPISAQKKAKF
ncbi:FAD-dependent oxidoreductase [Vibrio sinaloensis]|nr:FAD-dependent oxidoreductase [Vibrio sinaloensis]